MREVAVWFFLTAVAVRRKMEQWTEMGALGDVLGGKGKNRVGGDGDGLDGHGWVLEIQL